MCGAVVRKAPSQLSAQQQPHNGSGHCYQWTHPQSTQVALEKGHMGEGEETPAPAGLSRRPVGPGECATHESSRSSPLFGCFCLSAHLAAEGAWATAALKWRRRLKGQGASATYGRGVDPARAIHGA